MEISEFRSRKLARRFKTFDTDGDGFVEREDFVLSVTRMGTAKSPPTICSN